MLLANCIPFWIAASDSSEPAQSRCYRHRPHGQRYRAGRSRKGVRENLKGSGVFSQCRDKASLDIFWLRDESLEESDNLPDPDVLGPEIVKDLRAVLEQFREIAVDLSAEVSTEKIKIDER